MRRQLFACIGAYEIMPTNGAFTGGGSPRESACHGPIPSPCAGTLIKGPNNRNFILTARHCYALETSNTAQPLSSHMALFNYRLPCNATRAGNTTKAFPDFLQAWLGGERACVSAS